MMTIGITGMAPPGIDRFAPAIDYPLGARTARFRCLRDCVTAAA